MKYKAVLFDLDGTLCDTTEGVYASVAYCLDKLGLPEADLEAKKKFIGPPLTFTFEHEYGMTPEEAVHAAGVFREHYGSEGVFLCTAYPGMAELLQLCHSLGMRVGTATYKREDYAIKLLERKFPEGSFDIIRGSDHEGKLTKADIIEMAISQLGADKSETVLVGDTHFDAEGAYAAGIDFIAVTYGCGFACPRDVLPYRHAAVCANTAEIGEFLKKA